MYRNALARKVLTGSSLLRKEITQFSYGFVFDKSVPSELRLSCANLLLFPALDFLPPIELSDFYIEHVTQIMKELTSPWPERSKELNEAALMKSISFELMRICYSRLNSVEYHSKTGKILSAFLGKGKTGDKELTFAVIKAANEFKKGVSTEIETTLRQLYSCTAYNALATALASTQSLAKIEVFAAYLFSEKPILWEYLVDTSKTFFHKR
ncbi:NUC194 domain-containing protein [Chytridium lagenaria]|nr:NUC194 domain-containing protein [Chytridium lagenaria]